MQKAMQHAYQYIKNRILDGTYRPAQRLVEMQLSEEIGVSRNTLKKALLQLAEEHLVTLEDNKGAVVASFTLPEIEQYYEIRKALEQLVVREAAKKISDKDVDKLRSIYALMQELRLKGEFTAYSQNNKKFHEVIYCASGKTIAVDMIRGIKNQLSRLNLRTILVPGRPEQSSKEHLALVEAMAAHDGDKAVEAINNHVDHVLETIREYRGLIF